ncbi:MAG: malectin domain-containing carbohydrate-binding protein [Planctomycetota bacterium]
MTDRTRTHRRPGAQSPAATLAEPLISAGRSVVEQLEARRLLAATYRVNAGGDGFTDALGQVWQADTAAAPAPESNAFVAQSQAFTTGAAIDLSDPSIPAGTDPRIFQSERWDPGNAAEMEWDIPVDPGDYVVRLYFAEISNNQMSVGGRLFDVAIEGQTVVDDVDVFAEVGANAGLVRTFTVQSDANLDIDFDHVFQNPAIKGIEVIPLSTAGQLSADPGQLDFGSVEAGQTLTQNITVENLGGPGDQDIEVTAATLSGGGAAAYSVDLTTPLVLAAGESAVVPVTFAPTDAGSFDAEVTFTHDGSNVAAVALSGLATDPPPPAEVLYRVNAGYFEDVADPTGGPDWEADPQEGGSPYTNDDEAFSNSFITSASVDLTHPSVPDNLASTFQGLSQSQRWDKFGGEPMRWSFPTGPGTYEVVLYFAEIGQQENAPGARVFDVSAEGVVRLDDYDTFVEAGGGFKLVAERFEVVVTDASLDLQWDLVAGTPMVMALEVLGTPDVSDPFVLGASNLDFGDVEVGQSASLPVTLTNNGASALQITGLPTTGPGAALFGLDTAAPFSLLSGETRTINVTYTPTTVAAANATLTVERGGLSDTVSLSGTGVAAPTGTSTYRINAGGSLIAAAGGDWQPDTDADPSPFSNFSTAFSSDYVQGNPIDLSDPSIPAGTPEALFRSERWDPGSGEEMQWSFPVEPGEYDVLLYFAEISTNQSSVGGRIFDVSIEGQLVLDNYDIFAEVGANAGVVKTFNVDSDGILNIDFDHVFQNPAIKAIEIIRADTAGQLSVSPTALDFGTVDVGESGVASFTVTNLGEAGDPDITVNGLSFSSTAFASGSILPVTLPAGASTTINVSFNPLADGPVAGTVTVLHDGDSTNTIALSGVGFDASAPNEAPTVNPGTAPAALVTVPVALGGSVSDDGRPVDGALTSTWTKVSGPGDVIFSDPADPGTDVTFDQVGLYTLRLTATDGELTSFADLTVNVVENIVPVGFGKSTVAGVDLDAPTSLQFGPDGNVYVAQQSGNIKAYSITRNGPNDYSSTLVHDINLVKDMPNRNDDGELNPSIKNRLVTGIVVTGTEANPVIYVVSSDPRIGGGPGASLTDIDTNSGVLSRLTWTGTEWVKLDLVNGLPRSKENHTGNGLVFSQAENALYIGYGGNTNAGAPSANFELLPEFALSAAVLRIDLTAIGETTYNLPTLDDEDRPGVNDEHDPFGGNEGKNQAVIVPGGPVQVYAPGFRNPYDLVLTRNGNLYVVDNGANADWGAAPLDSNGNITTAATAGDATNAQSEPGQTWQDGLHLITGEGYYGGHANPTRANRANTFNDSNPQSPVPAGFENPVEGHFLPSGQNGSLWENPASTNGLTEYTGNNFGGALDGDLLAVAFDNTVWHIPLSPDGQLDGTPAPLFQNVGIVPLDVTTQGVSGEFPGTIWVAEYLNDQIVVFEPNDFDGSGTGGTGAYDPNLDEDNDGYNNADEIDNGTNPLSAGDIPPDFDGDFTSDLNDIDDDNDTTPDEDDPFAIDPDDGASTPLPVRYGWENEGLDNPGGLLELGWTGLMTNGLDNYRDLFFPDQMTAGGAAGVMTFDNVTAGTAWGSNNDQEQALQFGTAVTSATGSFYAHTKIQNPFSGITPQAGQEAGMQIGTGDQDNYLSIVTAGNNGGELRAYLEIAGSPQLLGSVSLPMGAGTNVQAIDLYIRMDAATGAAILSFAATISGITGAVQTVATTNVPTSWFAGPAGLAVGVISTTRGAGQATAAPAFPVTYDFIDVLPVQPSVLALESEPDFTNVAPGSSSTQNVILANLGGPGDPAITVSALDLLGVGASAYSLGIAAPFVLEAGQSVAIPVTFTPTTDETPAATLRVTHDGNGGLLDVELPAISTNYAPGLVGSYYNTRFLTELVETRIDPTIDFIGWNLHPPDTSVLPDKQYSVRWEGAVLIDQPGAWEFETFSDDGVRLWIDGQLIIDNWTNHPGTYDVATINLDAGWHELRLEYYQNFGGSVMMLSFEGPGQPKTIIPATHLGHATQGSGSGELAADVSLLNFGPTDIGSSSTQQLTLTHTGGPGADPITITDLFTDANGYSTNFDVLAIGGSLTLSAGESVTVDVTFAPDDIGDASGSLTVTTSAGSLSVSISGVGVAFWTVENDLPAALGEVGNAVIGDTIYVVGDGDATTFALDTNTGAWTSLPARPHPAKDQIAHAIDGKLYVIGGVVGPSSNKEALDYVQVFDPATNTWSLDTAMPYGSFAANTAVIGGKLYVAGGLTNVGFGSGVQTHGLVSVFDPVTHVWTTGLAEMPLAADSAATGTNGSSLFVFGGRSGGDAVSNGFDTVQIYDPATDTWITSSNPGGPAALPQARGGIVSAPFIGGKFYVIGGETQTGGGATSDNVYDRVDIYDTLTDTWTTGPSMITPRHGMSPIVAGGRIYVIGGGEQSGRSFSDAVEYLTITVSGNSLRNIDDPESLFAGRSGGRSSIASRIFAG